MTPKRSKVRSRQLPALLRVGLRPFFLLAGFWAVFAVPFAMALAFNGSTAAMDFRFWHMHEMVFGYAMATISGFLLTAIPNWTGRLPVRGWPLAGLAVLWLAGRAAVVAQGLIEPWMTALVDVAFLACLGFVIGVEILAGKNWRNAVVLVLVVGLLVANAVSHLEANGHLPMGVYGIRFGIGVVVGLIMLIGGRIVPSFTRNWLVKQSARRLPRPFGMFDRIALLIGAAALAAWVISPDSRIAAIGMVTAGILHLLRVGRWAGDQTGSEALVWVLHVGYAWLAVGLILIGLSHWIDGLTQAMAIHALTVGGIGTMTVAVMTRATLGHTGRALTADRLTIVIYLLISVSAMLRLISGLSVEMYQDLVLTSAAAWTIAFALFLVRYGPMLVGR